MYTCVYVRDDCRVNPDHRTRNARPDPEPLRRLRDPAKHGPDEGAVTLRVDPRVDVVRDQAEAESGLLRRARVADKRCGRVLLT
jgi:hypothetical protein